MKLETLALHAGQKVGIENERAVPVYRTASYLFKSTEHAENLFSLKELGNIYTRLMNPTQNVLEERVAALEGGRAAVATSSGTSAIYYSIINICKQGDEVVSSKYLYGGTFTMFNDILPHYGINVKFVDIYNLEEVENAITDKTKVLFTEIIGNPTLDVADIEALAKIAHKHEIPLVVDSTFTTPYLIKPIEFGADIVVHSLTKWMGGHGTAIGGIAVDAGNFDWNKPKFPLYYEPEPSYHGLKFGSDLPEPLNKIAFALRFRLVPLRNLGACISPDNAWIFLQGIETLALRMERHCENALKVAKFLKNHPNVEWVRYPGLEDDKSYPIAKKLFKDKGYGGMVVFGIKGGVEAGRKFIEKLKLFSHLANVGDAKSLAIHPASTTHSQLTQEQQLASGITPDLVRLSIGIEHIDDILADLEQALQN